MCDVVYAILVGRVDALAVAAIAGGAEDADPEDARNRFDTWLRQPLGYLGEDDREQAELLLALGLR